jgi:hypothetical protein
MVNEDELKPKKRIKKKGLVVMCPKCKSLMFKKTFKDGSRNIEKTDIPCEKREIIYNPKQIFFNENFCMIEYFDRNFYGISYEEAIEILKCWKRFRGDWLFYNNFNDVIIEDNKIAFYCINDYSNEPMLINSELQNIRFSKIFFPFINHLDPNVTLYVEEESDAVKKLKSQKNFSEWDHNLELFYRYHRFNPVLYWEMKVKFTEGDSIGILTQHWQASVTVDTLINLLKQNDKWEVMDRSQAKGRNGSIEWLKGGVELI